MTVIFKRSYKRIHNPNYISGEKRKKMKLLNLFAILFVSNQNLQSVWGTFPDHGKSYDFH